MTATMDLDVSVVGQPNHYWQNLLSFISHTPPAQPSHSTTIPRDTVKSNQTDDEQSGVKHGHEAGTNHNSQTDDEQCEVRNGNEAVENTNGETDDEQSQVRNGNEAVENTNGQTDDEQSEVRNGNEAVENKKGQTDDEQSGITHGHEAGANKPVSQLTVIEQQGDLLKFPHSIAHCIWADFKLGAGLAKQIKEKFRSYFPTKKEYKQQVLHAKYLGHDKFVFHLIVKPRYFHKLSYRSLRKTLLALRDQMSFYRTDKLCIPHLSCGLDNLDWTEVHKIIHEPFRVSNLGITNFTHETPRERTTSGGQTTLVGLQEAQTTDTGIKQVLTRVRKQSRPPRSQSQGLPRNVWKNCNLFDELTIRHGNVCRKHENLKTGQMIFQQLVPLALVQSIFYFLHSDHTSAHLGVTNTLEKVRSLFYWPGHERDVEVFVASCFVCQKRNSPHEETYS